MEVRNWIKDTILDYDQDTVVVGIIYMFQYSLRQKYVFGCIAPKLLKIEEKFIIAWTPYKEYGELLRIFPQDITEYKYYIETIAKLWKSEIG